MVTLQVHLRCVIPTTILIERWSSLHQKIERELSELISIRSIPSSLILSHYYSTHSIEIEL